MKTAQALTTRDGDIITDLELEGPQGTRTNATADGVLVVTGKRIRIRRARIRYGRAAAIFVQDCEDVELEDVEVEGGMADGIHVVAGATGARGVSIIRPKVRDTGDDYIAVVDQNKHAGRCEDIYIESPDVGGGQTVGRGIAVIGGRRVTVRGGMVRDWATFGLHCAHEPSYDTKLPEDVTFDGVTLLGSATTHAQRRYVHGVRAKRYTVRNVTAYSTGPMWRGLDLYQCDGALVAGNRITNCADKGLHLLQCANYTLGVNVLSDTGGEFVG